MSTTLIIIIGMQTLSLLAPFIALYAVSLARQKKYELHQKIQKTLFFTCVLGVVILEVHIRLSGGSGSLVENCPYVDTLFFKIILIAHITGAVFTYICWAITIFWSNKKFRKVLPGNFSKIHKKLGYITIIGLFYTGITSLIVVTMAFFQLNKI